MSAMLFLKLRNLSHVLRQPALGTTKVHNDLLNCRYSIPGADSSDVITEKTSMVDREQYPFCHVLSAGQVALYWTHDGLTRQGE